MACRAPPQLASTRGQRLRGMFHEFVGLRYPLIESATGLTPITEMLPAKKSEP
jgi:hypothetical protein